MRLLFAHDHIFYRFDDVMYSTGGLSKEMIERYTSVFDEVQIVSRQVALKYFNEKLTVASTDNVDFTPVPNFKSLINYVKITEAKSIIEREVINSDAIIARLPSSIGNIAIEIAKKNNIPYLIEVVACPWDALWNHSLKGKVVAPFSYYKMKQLVEESKFTVYVTEKFLQKRYPTKGMNTNCSNVALQEFNEDVLRKRMERIENKTTQEPIIIGTTAAIDVKHKGQQYVIKALGKLKSEGITNYQYHLVGGGNQEYLKKIAEKHGVSDQIRFLGTMPHNKVFEWLDSIDLYVQPSRQEGLPRALVEAMSRAVPAFGARTAGIPELLDDKFIFSNTRKNIDEICEILKSFDKETMTKQATRNYEESKKYDKGIIEERRREFFEDFKKSKPLLD
ncbi:glycosyltransferase [Globicatella sulfidifaciens]|uniref:Glycosyltransferase involved in cell wall bisynthesis n=1 Tax=Globicatella sulfidifaciens DSM 15739 TaxID=1121925 RepID=A0A1T4NRK3_9LACT|nr:glycosyltransferase [Globicatella sulfidifaciens]SJZ81757.1 Glycosyltransferase involved in cell wall bisynthesis [Globicatella sulfidifaciens DSM 15739]